MTFVTRVTKVKGRVRKFYIWEVLCNGHYNCTPDLGRCVMWWNTWDSAKLSILDAKVLDRNVTWLTKHKDTS